MKIKYSIIIPHFNDEVGLTHLLDSIPPWDDVQVIVVDDRSDSNDFFRVVNESKLPNIEAFINDRVKSAGACRNIGLENATGEYLIFADSDDFFTSQAFENINSAIEKEPEADVYFFNVTSITESGELGVRHEKNRELVLNYINRKGYNFNEKLRFTHNVPWGKVIKKSLIDNEKIRFDQTIIANDGIFSLMVGKAAKLLFASENVIYCVASRSGSLTKQKDVGKFRVRLEVYVRYFHLLNDREKKMINASPLPLLYLSSNYGISEIIRSVFFLIKNKVSIFRYFKFKRRYTSYILEKIKY